MSHLAPILLYKFFNLLSCVWHILYLLFFFFLLFLLSFFRLLLLLWFFSHATSGFHHTRHDSSVILLIRDRLCVLIDLERLLPIGNHLLHPFRIPLRGSHTPCHISLLVFLHL